MKGVLSRIPGGVWRVGWGGRGLGGFFRDYGIGWLRGEQIWIGKPVGEVASQLRRGLVSGRDGLVRLGMWVRVLLDGVVVDTPAI